MAVNFEIFTQNIGNTERVEEYIEKKTSKLDKLLRGIEETRIDLAYTKSARNAADRNVAQITIRGKGFILRAEERAEDIFAAIDKALDKIMRQIERFKGKRSRNRSGSIQDIPPELLEAPVNDDPIIARRKEFTLVPMDELEAIEQMSLLGHENFFIFFNANTNKINVLYRRRNGDYGLIDPKVG